MRSRGTGLARPGWAAFILAALAVCAAALYIGGGGYSVGREALAPQGGVAADGTYTARFHVSFKPGHFDASGGGFTADVGFLGGQALGGTTTTTTLPNNYALNMYNGWNLIGLPVRV